MNHTRDHSEAVPDSSEVYIIESDTNKLAGRPRRYYPMVPVDRRSEHTQTDLDPEAIISVLEDEQCRTIVAALDEPKTAAELATTCGISPTSVYRKLEQLRDAAVVTPRLDVNVDGHHVWRYESNIDDVTIVLDADDPSRLDLER